MTDKYAINPEIKTTLHEYNIPVDEGILCLLSIYYNLTDIVRFEEHYELVYKQINASKIISRNYLENTITWRIPLFNINGLNEKDWSWVDTEYRALFRVIDKEKAASPKSVLGRMKKFFAEHPHVRKDDVIAAAKLYIQATEPKYVQQADYFISKGSGIQATSRLETYLEIYYQQNIKEPTKLAIR